VTYRRGMFRQAKPDVIEGGVPGEVHAWFKGADIAPWEALLPELADQLVRHWERARDGIMAEWIEDYPGTRPRGWWCFDRPEPWRKRLGGVGDAVGLPGRFASRGTNWCAMEHGLPRFWTTPLVARMRGGLPFDPADPPAYESQAVYLYRLKLLRPGERKRLRPDDFASVVLSIDNRGRAVDPA